MEESQPYVLTISRLTVEKLGIKLYDRASAVVAELVANAYDADAENVVVRIPLGKKLAKKVNVNGQETLEDLGFTISVEDDGHGMTPEEAQAYFLKVGLDRRKGEMGPKSREKERAVMGRKGIGKLAPFGICRIIEVLSSGGKETPAGFLTSHFLLDFEDIHQPDEGPVPLKSGEQDRTYRPHRGTTITLREFLPKVVPGEAVFRRQLARRFSLAADDFEIALVDVAGEPETRYVVPKFEVPTMEGTRLDLADHPVPSPDGPLEVEGWMGFAKSAYRDDAEAGVRIYARGKIVATTRDFELAAGYTNEFMARSYLVGELHAEWLDQDEGEDLIRTDRQGILWASDLGTALQEWGKELIRTIGARSRKPRREKVSAIFMRVSNLMEKARERFVDSEVVEEVATLGARIGGFASEDELKDEEYVDGLADIILTVAPHQALMKSLREFSQRATGETTTIHDMADLFGRSRVAEMASYAQIAAQHVQIIDKLEKLKDDVEADEAELQNLLARAPWLISPSFVTLTMNQSLKTFKSEFEKHWKDRFDEEIEIAIDHRAKRPDFTLVNLGGKLHVVEIKAPGHAFGNDDARRFANYLDAMKSFFDENKGIVSAFPLGWTVELVADHVNITDVPLRVAYEASAENVVTMTWADFLMRARTAHSKFLDARDELEGGTITDASG